MRDRGYRSDRVVCGSRLPRRRGRADVLATRSGRRVVAGVHSLERTEGGWRLLGGSSSETHGVVSHDRPHPTHLGAIGRAVDAMGGVALGHRSRCPGAGRAIRARGSAWTGPGRLGHEQAARRDSPRRECSGARTGRGSAAIALHSSATTGSPLGWRPLGPVRSGRLEALAARAVRRRVGAERRPSRPSRGLAMRDRRDPRGRLTAPCHPRAREVPAAPRHAASTQDRQHRRQGPIVQGVRRVPRPVPARPGDLPADRYTRLRRPAFPGEQQGLPRYDGDPPKQRCPSRHLRTATAVTARVVGAASETLRQRVGRARLHALTDPIHPSRSGRPNRR
jgi:hypothetical protein